MNNVLLSFFRQAKDPVNDNRPLCMRLAHPTQMLEDVLVLPQRVDGSEAFCGGIEYRILCVSLDAYISLKDLIALPVAVDIAADRGGLANCQLALGDALSKSAFAQYEIELLD